MEGRKNNNYNYLHSPTRSNVNLVTFTLNHHNFKAHLFLMSQYLCPFSVPYPTASTPWLTLWVQVRSLYTPVEDKTYKFSLVSAQAAIIIFKKNK